MAKISYICKECGHKSGKWFGKCTACGEWDTCVEELEVKTSKKTPQNFIPSENKAAVSIHEISTEEEIRIDLGNNEFNRVLGGGLVAGSLVLIGGEPGIGKSTLLLQTVLSLKNNKEQQELAEKREQANLDMASKMSTPPKSINISETAWKMMSNSERVAELKKANLIKTR